MACGIDILNMLSKSLPEEKKTLLLNALVISHLPYSALILIGLQKISNHNLKKQLNWEIKPFLIEENTISPQIYNLATKYYQSPFS